LFQTEESLINRLCSHLELCGDNIYREVACYSRRIDVLQTRDRTLWAFEAKLSKWQIALEQARHHLLAVDYSIVVLPELLARRIDKSNFADLGVGLIGVGSVNVITFIEPVKSSLRWEPASSRLKETVRILRASGGAVCTSCD